MSQCAVVPGKLRDTPAFKKLYLRASTVSFSLVVLKAVTVLPYSLESVVQSHASDSKFCANKWLMLNTKLKYDC